MPKPGKASPASCEGATQPHRSHGATWACSAYSRRRATAEQASTWRRIIRSPIKLEEPHICSWVPRASTKRTRSMKRTRPVPLTHTFATRGRLIINAIPDCSEDSTSIVPPWP